MCGIELFRRWVSLLCLPGHQFPQEAHRPILAQAKLTPERQLQNRSGSSNLVGITSCLQGDLGDSVAGISTAAMGNCKDSG